MDSRAAMWADAPATAVAVRNARKQPLCAACCKCVRQQNRDSFHLLNHHTIAPRRSGRLPREPTQRLSATGSSAAQTPPPRQSAKAAARRRRQPRGRPRLMHTRQPRPHVQPHIPEARRKLRHGPGKLVSFDCGMRDPPHHFMTRRWAVVRSAWRPFEVLSRPAHKALLLCMPPPPQAGRTACTLSSCPAAGSLRGPAPQGTSLRKRRSGVGMST